MSDAFRCDRCGDFRPGTAELQLFIGVAELEPEWELCHACESIFLAEFLCANERGGE